MTMSKLAIAIVALVVLAGVGGFFIFRNTAQTPGADTAPGTSGDRLPPAWIEVLKPSVSEKAADDTRTELKTGDAVRMGGVLETDSEGLAAVHFADGSVARIDSRTTVTVESASFDENSERLTVRIRIGVGRVWSKILGLVTADSLWEVQTTNAVATVRGTAFGMWYEAGTSAVVGSQDSVTVGVLDPKTGALLPDVAVLISPKKFVQIDTAEIEAIRKDPQRLAPRDAPAAILAQTWIQRDQAADILFDQKLDELRKSGLEGAALRREFREAIQKEFKTELKRGRPVESESKGVRPDETKKEPETIKLQRETSQPIEKPASAARPQPKSLSVAAKQSLGKVSEGDRIAFEATATMSDGSRENVTTKVSWRVLGLIGSIDTSGVFSAKLDESVSELGRSSGSVIATLENQSGGEPLLGTSPIFSVEVEIGTQPIEPRG